MALQRTFSIIKPDATRRNLTGAVTKMLEDAGLRVVASKPIRMTKEQGEGFYGVHRERPFFNDLVGFITRRRGCSTSSWRCSSQLWPTPSSSRSTSSAT